MTKTPEALIEELGNNISKLSEKDREFADSLINGKWGYRARGYLSARQWPWVERLIARANAGGEPDAFAVPLGKVHTFLMNARKTLKYPKIWIRVGERDVKLYLSGKKSTHPDSVNIVVYETEDKYRDDIWMGRILTDGTWHRPLHVQDEMVQAVMPAIGELADNPGAKAAEFGKLTGRCCFCNRSLSDEDRSTQVGFGPVCAKKYGLQNFWKAGNGATAHVAMTIMGNRPDMRT